MTLNRKKNMKVNGLMATKKVEAPNHSKAATALIILSMDSGDKDCWKVVQPTCIKKK